ncbi:unnamed protein product [Sphagnum jensenii]|uniref:YqaJ viral recombinase domain-containing protein n=1 Tax=Sphagnum jensenii TaxID=128206 RepID=A0ABP0VA51_9BRYO
MEKVNGLYGSTIQVQWQILEPLDYKGRMKWENFNVFSDIDEIREKAEAKLQKFWSQMTDDDDGAEYVFSKVVRKKAYVRMKNFENNDGGMTPYIVSRIRPEEKDKKNKGKQDTKAANAGFALPQQPESTSEILNDELPWEFEKLTTTRKPRGYLGCSTMGHPCDRYIWLNKYGEITFEIPLRKQRIFERGIIEESRILSLLGKVEGWTIESLQYPLQKGVLRGNADAVLKDRDGIRYILEIKTMNDKAFKEIKKHGIQKTQFSYWAQCQTYLYLSEDIHVALLLAVNKNDESMYEEVINLDSSVGETFLAKATRIHEQTEMPLGLMALKRSLYRALGAVLRSFVMEKSIFRK